MLDVIDPSTVFVVVALIIPDQERRQWAVAQVKRNQDGLDVYERIVTIHARRGVGSISAADRGTRYRWYGLYTKRAPRRAAGLRPVWAVGELHRRKATDGSVPPVHTGTRHAGLAVPRSPVSRRRLEQSFVLPVRLQVGRG